ncbi:uncharacterized protein VTP21DRAFT_860 [Calcarisporiella thermophila]|uniref:uncharacterized protein n=1 Tax=Calcarisporiella thermophila TaxID=911321 RepID=UPI00374225AA
MLSPGMPPSSPGSAHSSPHSLLPTPMSADFLTVDPERSMLRQGRSVSMASVASTATVRDILLRTGSCDVSRRKEGEWAILQEDCIVEIRLTSADKGCIAILLEEKGHMLLNAWILPTTHAALRSQTELELVCGVGGKQEEYLLHFDIPQDAEAVYGMLWRLKNHAGAGGAGVDDGQFVSRSASLAADEEAHAKQTLHPILQARCKVYLQNEYASWMNLGTGKMWLSTQMPSQKFHVRLENDKNRMCLLNAVIVPEWVERLAARRLTVMVQNAKGLSTVYMVQFKDEGTTNAIFEHFRRKRSGVS